VCTRARRAHDARFCRAERDGHRARAEVQGCGLLSRKQKAEQDYGTCKLYTLPDRTSLWIYEGGYTVARTPEGVEVSYFEDENGISSRTIHVPSGRICTVDEAGSISWGVLKEQAPDFRLGTLGNTKKRVRLSDLRGKVVLLDFWASWCEPCMEGLPETEALYQAFKDRGLMVFGINVEGDERQAAAAVKSVGITFPVLMGDPDAEGEFNFSCKQISDYRLDGIPAWFLIDKDGVIQRMNGIDEEAIEELL
jgi:thiol-disulfide isomerase/thioredoxin